MRVSEDLVGKTRSHRWRRSQLNLDKHNLPKSKQVRTIMVLKKQDADCAKALRF